MAYKNVANVYIKDRQFCICDENGKELFALESAQISQDWNDKNALPSHGLGRVSFTLVANIFDSEDQMKKAISDLK